MGPLCDCCCAEDINKLNQQVSVMRKEIKNLRQMLDAAVRAHRKHIVSVQDVLKFGSCEKTKDQRPSSPQAALEQGNIWTVPIGYIRSCFSVKNGTPRQPGVCGPSRAELTIQKSIFNNPEHALVGLEQYSHVWIIFLFHKNGHLSYKSKVKPPRLNGQRVGVYSTRSPHRPNALGLTLAKLDKTEGDTLHLSEIDMIDGTPVMDIKPYIPEYDSPDTRRSLNLRQHETNTAGSGNKDSLKLDDEDDGEILPPIDKSETNISFVEAQFFLPKETCSVLEEVRAFLAQDNMSDHDRRSENRVSQPKAPSSTTEHPSYGEEACATIASWIRAPPVACLDVRFTPHAEKQLAEFLPAHLSEPSGSNRPRFKFLCSPEEAVAAIRGVLSADPRSVYRRTRCTDRLFFFTIDTADITCWFGQGFVEVLQVQPVERHDSSV